MHFTIAFFLASSAGLATAHPFHTSRRGVASFPAGGSWDILLNKGGDSAGSIKSVSTESIQTIDIDLFDTDAATIADLKSSKAVICYFSAGSKEGWRSDAGDFKDGDTGKALDGWPDENWVNVTSPNVRNIMKTRIQLAAQKGCAAVDPDNVDGYDGNQDSFGFEQSAYSDYVKFMAQEASANNLAIGLKNAVDLIPSVVDVVQFAVNEQCHQYSGECEKYKPFTDQNKAVYNIEYGGNNCDTPAGVKLSTLIKPEDQALNTLGGACSGGSGGAAVSSGAGASAVPTATSKYNVVSTPASIQNVPAPTATSDSDPTATSESDEGDKGDNNDDDNNDDANKDDEDKSDDNNDDENTDDENNNDENNNDENNNDENNNNENNNDENNNDENDNDENDNDENDNDENNDEDGTKAGSFNSTSDSDSLEPTPVPAGHASPTSGHNTRFTHYPKASGAFPAHSFNHSHPHWLPGQHHRGPSATVLPTGFGGHQQTQPAEPKATGFNEQQDDQDDQDDQNGDDKDNGDDKTDADDKNDGDDSDNNADDQ